MGELSSATPQAIEKAKQKPSWMDALIKAAPDEATFREWMGDVKEFAGDFEQGASKRLGELPAQLQPMRDRVAEVGTGVSDQFNQAREAASGGLQELQGSLGGVADPMIQQAQEMITPQGDGQLGTGELIQLLQRLVQESQNQGANADFNANGPTVIR
jgi:hypothetical protein